MGWQRAAEVLFTSDWVSASEAVDCGIVLRTCDPGRVLDETMQLAARIATAPLAALVAIKSAMLAGRSAAVTAARAHEEAAFADLLGSAATRAALDDFGS
jgi:enoyl-CoA hydratase/carnithine racemase